MRKGLAAGICRWGAEVSTAKKPRFFAWTSSLASVRRHLSSGAGVDRKTYEVVVFGGNGFVGSNVCKALVGMGIKVAAINRSGAPREKEDWMSGVDYISADVFEPQTWRTVLHGAVGVVAAIGAFGNYEFMKKVNGDANILVAEEAAAIGVERMVFVSASFPPFPASVPLRGYIEGKEAAERAVRDNFPSTHIILKPSVIYGPQKDAHPLIAGIRALGPLQVNRSLAPAASLSASVFIRP